MWAESRASCVKHFLHYFADMETVRNCMSTLMENCKCISFARGTLEQAHDLKASLVVAHSDDPSNSQLGTNASNPSQPRRVCRLQPFVMLGALSDSKFLPPTPRDQLDAVELPHAVIEDGHQEFSVPANNPQFMLDRFNKIERKKHISF